MAAIVVSADANGKKDLASLFHVTAVSIDRISITIINRRVFAEGDSFKLRTADKVMNVVVNKVNDGSVILNCDGTLLTVPVTVERPRLDED